MTPRPAVVLACGQLLDARTFAPQLPALWRDFDVRVADHTRDETVGAMAARLLNEAPARFQLVAHAMGGFIAFEVLRQAPERVASLALLSTLASADGPAQTARREGYLRLVESGRFAEVVEERVPILLPTARQEDEPLLSVLRAMARDTGAEAFVRQQRAIMGRPDSRPSLKAIACPTLVAWGRQDGIATSAQQEEMVGVIPGARWEPVEGAGHMLTLERPRTVTALLHGWLSAHG